MKTKHILGIGILFIAIVLSLVIAAFNQPDVSAKNISAASLSMQITSTPTAGGVSEIGSTDGIVIMGVIIVLIVIAPILFFRKKN